MRDAMPDPAPPVLVESSRGRFVESRHRGLIAAVEPDGSFAAPLGNSETLVFLRSVAKPFQTLPVITSGAADRFGFTQPELAIMTSSHSGEAIHTNLVRSILDKIGLDEPALLCGAHYPFDEVTSNELRREGHSPTPIHNNCSGKHAGMLALAIQLASSVEDYIAPEHPVQILIRRTLASFANVAPNEIAIAIDGCSAPVFILTLKAIARAYALLVAPDAIEHPLRRAAELVVKSMTSFPQLIGGSHGRLDSELMTITEGRIISKVGADGVHLLGVKPNHQFPNGLGIAIKLESGDSGRARDLVVIEALRQAGVLSSDQVGSLVETRRLVRNHRNVVVGGVRTSFSLFG